MPLIGFGELLDKSIESFRKHFSLLFRLGILLYFIPGFIFVLVKNIYLLPFLEAFLSNNTLGLKALVFFLISTFGIALLIGIIIGLLQLLFSVTIIITLINKRAGKDMSVKEALSLAMRKYGGAIGLSIVLSIFLFFLYLCFIIPGIIFSIFWVFALYAFVTEDISIMDALKKSKSLVKGRWWTVFGYLFLFFIIIISVSFCIGIPIGIMGLFLNFINPAVSAVFQETFQLAVELFIVMIATIMYEKFYLSLKENPINKSE